MGGLSQLVQSLRAEDWLTPKLRESAETRAPGWGRVRTYVSPSAGGSDCARDAQLAMLGYDSGFSEKSRDRMDNGIYGHRRITEKYRRAGVLVADSLWITQFVDGSTSFEDEMHGEKLGDYVEERGAVTWTGEMDVVVGRSPGATTVHVGDLKTTGSHQYVALPRQHTDRVAMGRLLLNTQPRYVRQLARYVLKLREVAELWRPGTLVSSEAFIHWENTDSQDYRVTWFTVDDHLAAEATRNPELAVSASLRGEVIERPFARGSRTCKGCYRRAACDALEDGDEDTWERAREALETVRTSGLSMT